MKNLKNGLSINNKDSAHECKVENCCKKDDKRAFYHSEKSAGHRKNKDKVKELNFRKNLLKNIKT